LNHLSFASHCIRLHPSLALVLITLPDQTKRGPSPQPGALLSQARGAALAGADLFGRGAQSLSGLFSVLVLLLQIQPPTIERTRAPSALHSLSVVLEGADHRSEQVLLFTMSFSKLPPELKTQIAVLAKQNDDAHRALAASAAREKRLISDDYEESLANLEAWEEWFGYSTVALAGVNKQMREIALPLVLDVSAVICALFPRHKVLTPHQSVASRHWQGLLRRS
jgi:hypothetical protein